MQPGGDYLFHRCRATVTTVGQDRKCNSGFHGGSRYSGAKRQGRRLYFSPDVRQVQLSWKRDPAADRGTFAELLKRYRSESTLKIADDKEVIAPHSAYLLPGEKNHAPAPLSFELVRRAFVHEYALRFRAFRATGETIDTVEAPGFGR